MNIISYIDGRPILFVVVLIPVVIIGYFLNRYVFNKSTLLLFQIAAVSIYVAVFQLLFYGPFVDRRMIEYTEAKVVPVPSYGPNAYMFDVFAIGESRFGPLFSLDADVADLIRREKLETIKLGVLITRDYGKVGNLSFAYAYAGGEIFRPHHEWDMETISNQAVEATSASAAVASP